MRRGPAACAVSIVLGHQQARHGRVPQVWSIARRHAARKSPRHPRSPRRRRGLRRHRGGAASLHSLVMATIGVIAAASAAYRMGTVPASALTALAPAESISHSSDDSRAEAPRAAVATPRVAAARRDGAASRAADRSVADAGDGPAEGGRAGAAAARRPRHRPTGAPTRLRPSPCAIEIRQDERKRRAKAFRDRLLARLARLELHRRTRRLRIQDRHGIGARHLHTDRPRHRGDRRAAADINLECCRRRDRRRT